MPESRTAARVAGIAPFHVMDILARAQALEAVGCDIIHLEIGEPDFATPVPIVEAGVVALRAGHTHYTGALGLPALREAIAGFYAGRWQAAVDPARVQSTLASIDSVATTASAQFEGIVTDARARALPGFAALQRSGARLVVG